MAATQKVLDSGWLSPTSTGEDYNEWTNGSNAYASDNTYATTPASSGNARQDYYNFSLPTATYVYRVECKIEAKAATGTIADLTFAWSGDGGTTYVAESAATSKLTTSDVEYTLVSTVVPPTSSQISNSNFRLRIRRKDAFQSVTVASVDAVYVKILYTTETPKVYDSCTETSTTSLASHNPDVGDASSWSEFSDVGTTNLQVHSSDYINADGSGATKGSSYKNSTSVGTADYSVVVRFHTVNITANYRVYLFGRIQDSSNLYCVEFDNSNHVMLFKNVAGTFTQLGSTYDASGVDYANGDVWELSMTGTAITVYRNGSSVIDTTDSAHSSEGDPGIGIGQYRIATVSVDSTWKLDCFTVISHSSIATASVSPVSILATIPSVTATWQPSTTLRQLLLTGVGT